MSASRPSTSGYDHMLAANKTSLEDAKEPQHESPCLYGTSGKVFEEIRPTASRLEHSHAPTADDPRSEKPGNSFSEVP